MKNFLSLLLALLMLCGLCVSAQAEDDVYEELDNRIITGWKERKSFISLADLDLGDMTPQELSDRYSCLYYENIVYSFLHTSSVKVASSKGKILGLTISKYNLPFDETEKVLDEVTIILYNLKKLPDDVSKTVWLHDYLCGNITYDDGKEARGIYGCLVEKKCVCREIAAAFSLIMNAADIPCYVVTSEKLNHAWNMVTIDGRNCFVDCTSDLGGPHRYLLCDETPFIDPSDGEPDWVLNKDGGISAAGICTESYPDAWWDDVFFGTRFYDGAFYFCRDRSVICRENGTETKIFDIKTDMNTCGIEIIGDKIYFPEKQKIYKADLNGENKTLAVDYSDDIDGSIAAVKIEYDLLCAAEVSDSSDISELKYLLQNDIFSSCVHDFTKTEVCKARCISHAINEIVCKNCGKTGYDIMPKTEHIPGEATVVKAATCSEKGQTLAYCTVCGLSVKETLEINPDAHTDADQNGICDDCGIKFCNHICHKSGFLGFIYKGYRFVCEKLNIKKTCSCGCEHY